MWSRLGTSAQWQNLTVPQRVWCVVKLAGASDSDSTGIAYNTTSPENCRILSYEIAANPRIVSALAVAAGLHVPPIRAERERKMLIRECRRQLKATERGSLAAAQMMAQLERLTVGTQV
jgi:hypothetical protein